MVLAGRSTAVDPVGVIWAKAPAALRFLAGDWGFAGPELTHEGVAYHRPALHVQMGFWSWKNERGFTTTVTWVGGDGTEQHARLDLLYAACGLGAVQDVPDGAGTLHVIRKRIGQHSRALRAVMPRLDDADADSLFRRQPQP